MCIAVSLSLEINVHWYNKNMLQELIGLQTNQVTHECSRADSVKTRLEIESI